jgi:hypothetical protein
MKTPSLAILLLATPWLYITAQTYSIDWSSISGGGGESTGGVYAVTGAITQVDTSRKMTGGDFTLHGGFWSFIAVVQTPGAPRLTIQVTSANDVLLAWPDSGENWRLQKTTDLQSPSSWIDVPGPYSSDSTSFFFSEPADGASMFYRLAR